MGRRCGDDRGRRSRLLPQIGVEVPDRPGNVAVRCFLDGHPDGRPSASIDTSTGKWKCHACDAGGGPYHAALARGLDRREAVELVKHYGLWMGDGGAERRNGSGLGREIECYPYLDETGELFEVIRFEPKTFRPRRPDGAGGWIWNLEGTERVLYRLPEGSGPPRMAAPSTSSRARRTLTRCDARTPWRPATRGAPASGVSLTRRLSAGRT